jgi:hypothetical protein
VENAEECRLHVARKNKDDGKVFDDFDLTDVDDLYCCSKALGEFR